MSITSEIRLRVRKEGDVVLNQLSAKLNDVAQRSTLTSAKFKDLSSTLKQTDNQIRTKSINGLNDYARAWRELANNVDITSQEFRQATREAERFERQAAKAQGKRFGGGISSGGAIAGVASAGLLGPEALLGAGVGALVGSPLAGAAIGSTVIAPARRAAGEVAESVADINRFRIALAGVSDDFEDYQKSAIAIRQATNDFLLPIDAATQQYTRLKASVRGAGLGTEETTKVFRGISAAIISTGGSAEDLNSALVATSQVFSKGKVSAEELRQQIGERLPGAFTIFAQSIGKTPQELDKALEQGEVSLEDFLTFSEELFKRYGETSEILANAPENAGKRLTVALKEMQENFGGFFAQFGAKIQDYITNLIKFVNQNSQQLKKLVTDVVNSARIIGQLASDIGNITISVGMAVLNFLKAQNPVFKILLGSMELGLKNTKDLLKTYAKFREIKLLSVSEVFPEFVPTSFGTGLGTDLTSSTEGQEEPGKTSNKLSKNISTSQELYELGLLRVEALDREDALNVALLDHKIRLQGIEEMNADANTKNLKIAESRRKFEQDIEKHIENQNNAAVKFETVVGDTLRSTQKLTEEEEKRIKNNQALVPIIEAGITAIKLGVLSAEELADAIRKIKAAFAGQDGEKSFFEDFKKSFKAGIKDMGDLAGNLGSTLAGAFRGASDVLTDFLTKGTADFKEFARSVLADLANILIQFALLEGLKAITGLSFANGGIMSKDGEVPLKKYAAGGIANSPQLAMFGEGSTPEAYVPLPDGRSIPVTMKGAGSNVQVDSINITVENTGEQLSPAAQKQIANQVQGIVMSTLVNERRSGGVLR